MRPGARVAAAAVTAVLAATTLTGCRTNVGYAATIDGTRYTESDIADYVTPAVQPVPEQDPNGATLRVPARSYVIETLITQRILREAISALPGRDPNADELDRVRDQLLAGKSASAYLSASGIKGFSSRFDDIVVRSRVYITLLQSLSQQGVDVNALVRKADVPVSVNPRYGRWDAAKLAFDSAAGSGAPAFVTLRTGAATGATEGVTGP